MVSEQEAKAVKQRHAAEFLAKPGVCGIGVEKDESGAYVLAVHIDAHAPDLEQSIPSTLDGVPIKLTRSGPFSKQDVSP